MSTPPADESFLDDPRFAPLDRNATPHPDQTRGEHGGQGVSTDTSATSTAARQSQATLLVQLAAEAEVEWFHDGDDGYATCTVNQHHETHRVRSKYFGLYLRKLFYQRTHKVPNAQALQSAVALCEAKGRFEGEQRHVYTRLAEHGGNIYLDLADDNWRAIQVTTTRWNVVSDPPVRFRRARGMLPLPVPTHGGNLDELREMVNVATDDDYRLLGGWLVAALRPRGPYPALAVHGEQGSAKSTLCRLVRNLIDPNIAALRAEPRDARDLIIAATNGWIVALDNVSHLPVWLSDALCRLATGGGFSTRELYTDGEEALFDAQRPTILNGITEVATRPDLLDRALLIEAPRIEEHQRRTETDLTHAFEAARPRLLGALLNAVVTALASVASVKLDRLPRMADFASWVVAADGNGAEAFLRAYSANRANANDIALEASEIAPQVRAIIENEGQWTGTVAELLTRLNQQVEEKRQRQPGWPRSPRALSGALRRIAPNLRASGIGFETKRGSRRVLILTRLEESGNRPTEPTVPTGRAENQGFSRDGSADDCNATDAGNEAKKPSTGVASVGCDGIDGDLQPSLIGDEEHF